MFTASLSLSLCDRSSLSCQRGWLSQAALERVSPKAWCLLRISRKSTRTCGRGCGLRASRPTFQVPLPCAGGVGWWWEQGFLPEHLLPEPCKAIAQQLPTQAACAHVQWQVWSRPPHLQPLSTPGGSGADLEREPRPEVADREAAVSGACAGAGCPCTDVTRVSPFLVQCRQR